MLIVAKGICCFVDSIAVGINGVISSVDYSGGSGGKEKEGEGIEEGVGMTLDGKYSMLFGASSGGSRGWVEGRKVLRNGFDCMGGS